MARLSISEAARQAGISRQYFYTKFVNSKAISISVDEQGNKYIDRAELLRVCDGRLPMVKPPSTKDDTLHAIVDDNRQQLNDVKTATLQAELTAAHERIAELQKDKAWLQGKVDDLAATLKQIEHKPVEEPKKKRWWQW